MTKAELRDELENCKVSLEAEKKKREESFANGVKYANLQMWNLLKKYEKEIERLRSLFDDIENLCKMYNNLPDRPARILEFDEYLILYNEDIKSIVTKEQFESMKYKVK